MANKIQQNLSDDEKIRSLQEKQRKLAEASAKIKLIIKEREAALKKKQEAEAREAEMQRNARLYNLVSGYVDSHKWPAIDELKVQLANIIK